jgi:phosphate/sulfate permease
MSSSAVIPAARTTEGAQLGAWRSRAWIPAVVIALALAMAGGRFGLPPAVTVVLAGAVFGVGMVISLRASFERLDEAARRQRGRSVAIAAVLFALVALFYAATIVRLGPNALRKDGFSGPAKERIDAPAGTSCKQAGTC